MSKFLPTLSSRFIFHIGVIQKYMLLWSLPHHDVPHCALMETENKWLMELITAAYCWQIINKLHCSLWNILLSSGLQVNYFPSFQMLSTIRHADSLVKFLCALWRAAYWSLWTSQHSLYIWSAFVSQWTVSALFLLRSLPSLITLRGHLCQLWLMTCCCMSSYVCTMNLYVP
jgi:hypothetical protein